MRDEIKLLLQMGKIPNDENMSDELFKKYDYLIQLETNITWEEAEVLVTLFSDDCDDLNWGLVHAIESLPIQKKDNEVKKYKMLVSKCTNNEYRLRMLHGLDNWLK